MKNQIIELNRRIEEARKAYYVDAQPILSDAEYDQLEKQLEAAVKGTPEFRHLATALNTVGSDLTPVSGRVKHSQPMLSIENKYEESDLIDWYATLPSDTPVCLEPKFDGISVELLFKDRILVQAATRGTGLEGEDITAQVMAVASIPKKLDLGFEFSETLRIRGELVMKNSTLERINAQARIAGGKVYSSTRNLTSGTMKLKDISLIPDREILMMPWDVLGGSYLPDSGLARLQAVAKVGFPEPLGVVVNDKESVNAVLRCKLIERIEMLRNQMSLETDGVVIKVDSHGLRKELGVGSKYTNYQVCFKPQSARGETFLRAVEWQVGRSGKLTPVGIVDPLNLAGAVINKVNLNNISWIRAMGLKINSKIVICRSGDVIPVVERVLGEELE